MKRFLILGVLALASAAASQQNASAWINSNFGLGMNWSWQSGGNSCLGGLCKCGQPCAPDYEMRAVPVYSNRPCCCQTQPQVIGPQVICSPGAQAPMQAPMPAPCPPGAGNGGNGYQHSAAPTQTFRPYYYPVSNYRYGR